MIRVTADVKLPAKRPSLYLVGRRQRAMHWLIIGGLVVFTLMIGAAWFQTQLARRQVILDRLDREVLIESQRNNDLRLEHSTLLSPAALINTAGRMGMQPVGKARYVTVRSEIAAYVQMFAPLPRQRATSTPTDALEQIGAVKAAVGDKQ